jgi:3-phosphoshikimate 1-carboxyvinyltransferase
MEAVTVHPAGPLRGEVVVPGDKSITHRAYLLAALAEGECRVRGANTGEDCERTLALVRALGVDAAR